MKARTPRPALVQCSECWNDTRGRCQVCGRPICDGCAQKASYRLCTDLDCTPKQAQAKRHAATAPPVQACRCARIPGEEKPTGADALVMGPHHSILCDLWKGMP